MAKKAVSSKSQTSTVQKSTMSARNSRKVSQVAQSSDELVRQKPKQTARLLKAIVGQGLKGRPDTQISDPLREQIPPAFPPIAANPSGSGLAKGNVYRPAKKRLPDIPSVPEQGTLILENMESAIRIAWSMLNRWRVRLPSDEVQSVTGVALCEAASRFDRNIGVAFRTFFFYHLRGLLLREISRRINDSRSRTMIDDVENHFKIHEGDSSGWPVSLIEMQNPERQVSEDQVSRLTWDACKSLDELEKDIIVRFFVHDQTVADIAKELGYCRCHVSRVKSRALHFLSKRLQPVLSDVRENSNRIPLHPGDEVPTKPAKLGYRGGRGRRRIAVVSRNDNKAPAKKIA